MKQNLNRLISQMTLEEKAGLCSGKNFWETKDVLRLGIESITLTDGPHGVRKQEESFDHLGIAKSVPSTCFPPACLSSCSFDRDLIKKIGAAIAEEALQENVSVVLGPGANIKRSPLCGRNFEYISEDPYVTGELASAMIEGLQSKNVGASLKHYAANNQEKARLISDSLVDERALREIYLAGFEAAVKKAKPRTVMCSYNKINNTYVSESRRHLTGILRKEWGYQGVVVTDWGACNNRVKALKAGQDLEMPASNGINDKKIIEAVQSGKLDERVLDRAVKRLLKLILSTQDNPKKIPYDSEAHHNLARQAAAESAVLLKNDGILPVRPGKRVAVIGGFAKAPRYQGGGSSHLEPTQMASAYDELINSGIEPVYADGYGHTTDKPDNLLLEEAKQAAAGCDVVLIYAGLPDIYESEGFDRTHLSLPDSHNTLIHEIATINANTVVVLHCGSAVAMPWLHEVKGVLLMYLGGQAGGAASVDLLLGKKVPSGKLTETFPLTLVDTPAFQYFGGSRSVEYRESIYVGYRYYDKAQKEVLFPFGFGLSYTTFAYSNLRLSTKKMHDSEELFVTVTIKNTGDYDAKEIVQLYVKPPESNIYKAVQELKGFCSVYLKAGEEKDLVFALNNRGFAYYNVKIKDWHVESGVYTIRVAASSRDIRLQDTVTLVSSQPDAVVPDYRKLSPTYYHLPSESLTVPLNEFLHVYGNRLPDYSHVTKVATINSTLSEIENRWLGRVLYKLVKKEATKMFTKEETAASRSMEILVTSMIADMPLRAFLMVAKGKITSDTLEALVCFLNGAYIKGVRRLMKK